MGLRDLPTLDELMEKYDIGLSAALAEWNRLANLTTQERLLEERAQSTQDASQSAQTTH